jgi:integrase
MMLQGMPPSGTAPDPENWPRMDTATRRAVAERACDRADRQALWSLMEAYVNMILLCALAGLSISECVGLRWSDIDLATGQLALQPGHERRGQTVLLPSNVVDALRALPHGGGENVLGFASDVRARQRMKQLCNRAGVPYRGLQALRLGARKETGGDDLDHTRASRRERPEAPVSPGS